MGSLRATHVVSPCRLLFDVFSQVRRFVVILRSRSGCPLAEHSASPNTPGQGRLGLHTLPRELIGAGRETVPWELVACILTIVRFCGNKTELGAAERRCADSALEHLLGVPFQAILHYPASSAVSTSSARTRHRSCQHLLARYESCFGVEFELRRYDVTST